MPASRDLKGLKLSKSQIIMGSVKMYPTILNNHTSTKDFAQTRSENLLGTVNSSEIQVNFKPPWINYIFVLREDPSSLQLHDPHLIPKI